MFEVGHGYRTCPKMCMADSLILPMAPTRGELLVVFTSVMAATCGLGGGRWDGSEMAGMTARRRPAWREKCEDSAIPARGPTRDRGAVCHGDRARDALNAPARG